MRQLAMNMSIGIMIASSVVLILFGVLYGGLFGPRQKQLDCQILNYSILNSTCCAPTFNCWPCFNLQIDLVYISDGQLISGEASVYNLTQAALVSELNQLTGSIQTKATISCCYDNNVKQISLGFCLRTVILLSVLVPFGILFLFGCIWYVVVFCLWSIEQNPSHP